MGGRSGILEHQDILHSLAEVAIAFAGFTGVVMVLGGRENGAWQPDDAPALIALLGCSLGVVVFGFVPDLARASHLEPTHAWRVSGLLLGSYHLAIIVAHSRARWRVNLRGERQIGRSGPLMAVHVIGISLVLAQFLTVAGFFSPWLFFSYLLNLVFLLLMAGYAFVAILVEARSQGPAA